MKYLSIIILMLALAGCRTVDSVRTYDVMMPRTDGVYYNVKAGDTLWSISRSCNINMDILVRVNNLEDARDIQRGQRLFIPGVNRKQEAPRALFTKESFSWPLSGNVISYFGSKIDRTKNKGIDISAYEGASVKASRAGKVVFCDEWLKGFGKTVILDHGDSFQTVYAYNSILLVKIGDIVEQNSVIAKAGRSGRAKEPALHFEIRRDGEAQNPFYYLAR